MLKHTRNSAKRQFSRLTDAIGQFVVSEGEHFSRETVKLRKPVSRKLKVEPEVVDFKKGKLSKEDIVLVEGNGEDMETFVHENQGEVIIHQAASDTGNYVESGSPRRPPRHKKKSGKIYCQEICTKSKQCLLCDADQKPQELSQIVEAASSSIEKGSAIKVPSTPIEKKSASSFPSRLDSSGNTRAKSLSADNLGEESIHLREFANTGAENDCNIEQEESFIFVPSMHKGSKIKAKRKAPKPPNIANSTTIVVGRKGREISEVKLKKQAPKPPNMCVNTVKDVSSGKEHGTKSKKQAPTPPVSGRWSAVSSGLNRSDSWCELNLIEKVKKVKEETQILESMLAPSLEESVDELSKKKDVMVCEDFWTSDSFEDTPKVCVKDLQGAPTRNTRIESRSENPAPYFMPPVVSVENRDGVKDDAVANTYDDKSGQDTRVKNSSVIICERRQKAQKLSGETFCVEENDFVEGHSERTAKTAIRAESHKVTSESAKEKEPTDNRTRDEKDTYLGHEISKFAVGSGIYQLVDIDIDTFSEEKDCITIVTEDIEKVESEDDAATSGQIDGAATSGQIEKVNNVQEDLSNIEEFETISDDVSAKPVDKLNGQGELMQLEDTEKDKNALKDEVEDSKFKYLIAYSEAFGTSVSDVEEEIVNVGEYLEEGERKILEENDRSLQGEEDNMTGDGVDTEVIDPDVDFNTYMEHCEETELESSTDKMHRDIDEKISEQNVYSLEMKDAEEQQAVSNFQNTFHESIDYSAIDCVNDEVFCFEMVNSNQVKSKEVESGEYSHSLGTSIFIVMWILRPHFFKKNYNIYNILAQLHVLSDGSVFGCIKCPEIQTP